MTGPGRPPAPPPSLAKRLLRTSLPAEVRDDIVADLGEVYDRVRTEQGPARAAWGSGCW